MSSANLPLLHSYTGTECEEILGSGCDIQDIAVTVYILLLQSAKGMTCIRPQHDMINTKGGIIAFLFK